MKLGGKGDVSPKTKTLRITETRFCLILERNKTLQIFGDFWFLFQNRIFYPMTYELRKIAKIQLPMLSTHRHFLIDV